MDERTGVLSGGGGKITEHTTQTQKDKALQTSLDAGGVQGPETGRRPHEGRGNEKGAAILKEQTASCVDVKMRLLQ